MNSPPCSWCSWQLQISKDAVCPRKIEQFFEGWNKIQNSNFHASKCAKVGHLPHQLFWHLSYFLSLCQDHRKITFDLERSSFDQGDSKDEQECSKDHQFFEGSKRLRRINSEVYEGSAMSNFERCSKDLWHVLERCSKDMWHVLERLRKIIFRSCLGVYLSFDAGVSKDPDVVEFYELRQCVGVNHLIHLESGRVFARIIHTGLQSFNIKIRTGFGNTRGDAAWWTQEMMKTWCLKMWGSHGYRCNDKYGNVTIMGQTQQFRLVEGIGEYLTTVSLKWKESVKV